MNLAGRYRHVTEIPPGNTYNVAVAHRAVLAVVVLVVALSAAAADVPARRRAVRTPAAWTLPCSEVQGFPAVAVSTDAGASVLPHTETLEFVQINTFGLAAAGGPQDLLAVTARLLLASHDGGCSWAPDSRLVFPDHGYRLATAGELGTLAWAIGRPELFLLGETLTQRTAPTPLPITVSVDAQAPHQLAIADDEGAIWWSDDAGSTWQPRAKAPVRAPLYAVAFSPRGRLHAIASGLADGAQVTFDGGTTWTRAAGLDGLNVFTIAFSPVDPGVVWAVALNPRVNGLERRAIYRSTDGGRSFGSVLTASADIPMRNGFTLAPSPSSASLLYFALPGTTLVLIDETGAVVQRTEVARRDFDAIAFSPANSRVMYFGVKLSDMSAD